MSKWRCRSRSEDSEALQGRGGAGRGGGEVQEEAGGGDGGQAKVARTGDTGPDRCGNSRE